MRRTRRKGMLRVMARRRRDSPGEMSEVLGRVRRVRRMRARKERRKRMRAVFMRVVGWEEVVVVV